MFFRGDTISRACIACGEILSSGVGRCNECGSANYELMIDRNCGGTFLKLWCESEITRTKMRDIKTPILSDLGRISRAWQSRNVNPNTGVDKYIGVFAKILDDNE